MITSTQARQGEPVTVFTEYSTSLGYLVDGKVWEPSGSYWAREAGGIFPMTRFERDGGQGYLKAVGFRK